MHQWVKNRVRYMSYTCDTNLQISEGRETLEYSLRQCGDAVARQVPLIKKKRDEQSRDHG